MQRGSKTISSSLRPKIDTIKCNIRFAKNPFDGDSLVKTAIKELRAEGVNIIYNKDRCHYYNAETIDKKWGYELARKI